MHALNDRITAHLPIDAPRLTRRPGPDRLRRRVAALVTPLAAVALVASGAARAQHAVTAAVPGPATPPTVAAGGWSAWTPLPGAPLTFQAPVLAANPAGTLELATVGLDLAVRHSRFQGGAWSSPLAVGRLTFLPPALLVEPAGTPQMLVTATDALVTLSRFQSGAWSAPLPSGAMSFLPPAAASNNAANTLELITVGLDGGVRHSRFTGGTWSSPVALNVVTFLPPALIANPAGGLELAVIGPDRQVYHAHFAGSQWSEFRPTGVMCELVPALAVSGDGVVHLVAAGLDRSIVHSRLVNGAWTAPAATGLQSTLSPALAASSGSSNLELLARGLDRQVLHGRFVGSSWQAPVGLGITTDARPALVAASGTGLDAAVLGTDGRVYASHFQIASAPAAATVSFKTDILKIFTNNGGKTCARPGCHAGPSPQMGMNLQADQAHQNIVNVASKEKPNLKRVLPGDANNSYLYMKITGAAGITGDRMPQFQQPLTAQQIQQIHDWINAGAPNN